MTRLAILMLMLGLAPAQATEPAPRNVNVEQARAAVQAAIEKCREDGHRVSAAVVDTSGLIKAQLRDDGAGPHTLDSSRRKAYSAASLGESTGKLAALVGKRPELQGLGRMNDSILLLGGGFPIRLYGRLIGGIGVGGAPGAALDEACARAGLKTLGAEP